MMKLAFYKVINSQDYDRHSFDDDNTPQETLDKLAKLKDDEWSLYDMERYGYGREKGPNAADFEDDYNDECLDGGWWVKVLTN